MMVQRFLRGLRPKLWGRLQAVTYTNVSELTEMAVNVEEWIELEKGEKLRENEKSEGKKENNREFQPGVLRINQPGGRNQNNDPVKPKVGNQGG